MQVHRIWIHNEGTLAMIFCSFPFSHYLFFESESTMNFICDLLISFSFQARSILLIARGGRKCTPETGFWNPLIFPGKLEFTEKDWINSDRAGNWFAWHCNYLLYISFSFLALSIFRIWNHNEGTLVSFSFPALSILLIARGGR